MNWEKLFKRYVWDDDRTPYFVPVAKMTRKQADHEVYFYTLFLGILFSIVCLVSISGPDRSEAVTLYAFTAIVSTVVLGVTKQRYASYYCGAVPVAVVLYFLLQGFPANLAPIDHFFLIAFCLVWLRYSFRIINIAKAYPDMPDAARADQQ